MPNPTPQITPDFYQILSLPKYTSLPKQHLKTAYHKALLKNHPDKTGRTGQKLSSVEANSNISTKKSIQTCENSTDAVYTIDQITTAYKTLSDPSLRAEYDRSLRLDRDKLRIVEGEKRNGDVYFHTGLEVVDLEDFCYDEGSGRGLDVQGDGDGADADADADGVWYRGCRCGDESGFLITENDLEKEAEHGEIVVGCRGCSLWLKVLFGVEDAEGS